jgi:hypothetical protein
MPKSTAKINFSLLLTEYGAMDHVRMVGTNSSILNFETACRKRSAAHPDRFRARENLPLLPEPEDIKDLLPSRSVKKKTSLSLSPV